MFQATGILWIFQEYYILIIVMFCFSQVFILVTFVYIQIFGRFIPSHVQSFSLFSSIEIFVYMVYLQFIIKLKNEVLFVLFSDTIWARLCENLSYAICEQQRWRSACTSAQSDQHLCCSLLREYDMSTCFIQRFKILASFCSWAGWFDWKSLKTHFRMMWLILLLGTCFATNFYQLLYLSNLNV